MTTASRHRQLKTRNDDGSCTFGLSDENFDGQGHGNLIAED
ncbi:MAG: hypothetical protein AAGI68_02365 [Planctomycetota bacterium]